MTRERFRDNLLAAFRAHGAETTATELNGFLDYNYDEDSDIASWGYKEFDDFANDVARLGLAGACEENHLCSLFNDEPDEGCEETDSSYSYDDELGDDFYSTFDDGLDNDRDGTDESDNKDENDDEDRPNR